MGGRSLWNWGRRGERGAALLEFAVLVPVFLLLIFGALEFGLAFKERHAISHSANLAARMGSTLGTAPNADIEILRSVEAGLTGAAAAGDIVYVRIYQAAADGSQLAYNQYGFDGSTACHWSPCPDPGSGTPTYGSPANWPPESRDVILDDDGLQTLGVEIRYTHTWVTGILGYGPSTWSETAHVRLEPDVFGALTP